MSVIRINPDRPITLEEFFEDVPSGVLEFDARESVNPEDYLDSFKEDLVSMGYEITDVREGLNQFAHMYHIHIRRNKKNAKM